ncbi:MAG: hypothetical protein IJJ99_03300 [Oscillospiraceae bacterium]|nr:hypothetical protein [Oscillospiraceae bacterium]
MIDPRNLELTRDVFPDEMLLVSVSNAYAYDGGQRTDIITGIRCCVVIPSLNYERLNVKLPKTAIVDDDLIGFPVEFSDFVAKIYVMNGRPGITATASAVYAA